jgi:hypothetical protein
VIFFFEEEIASYATNIVPKVSEKAGIGRMLAF